LQKFCSLALGGSQAILEDFHLDVLLIFDVLLQDRNWRTTNGRDKIGMSPQSRKFAFQMWELLTKQSKAKTFDLLHEFMYSKLRVYFTKDMKMLGRYFQFQNFAI
jgi:hypothetical protein